jgi:hypothetical protein
MMARRNFRKFPLVYFEKTDGLIQIVSGYISGNYQWTVKKAAGYGSILELECAQAGVGGIL